MTIRRLMPKVLGFSLLTILLFAISPLSMADIYMYEDEYGQKHFVNRPVEGGKMVKGLSPLTAHDEDEDVQSLLQAPRFSREVTMNRVDSQGFAGNYPKPFSLRGGSGRYKNILEKQRGDFRLPTSLSYANRSLYEPYINEIAKKYKIEPALVHAVITVESAYNPQALSHAGAEGLMQLMPPTARRFGVRDSYDPIQNIEGGVAYLRFLLDTFNDISLALAGYNAGEGAVMKYGNKIPPYRETQAYVPKVLEYYYRYLREGKYR